MSASIIVTHGPDLGSVLLVVDSCGGADDTSKSKDWNEGYNAALLAVENEIKRTWYMMR